jgi:hypothetical protein
MAHITRSVPKSPRHHTSPTADRHVCRIPNQTTEKWTPKHSRESSHICTHFTPLQQLLCVTTNLFPPFLLTTLTTYSQPTLESSSISSQSHIIDITQVTPIRMAPLPLNNCQTSASTLTPATSSAALYTTTRSPTATARPLNPRLPDPTATPAPRTRVPQALKWRRLRPSRP